MIDLAFRLSIARKTPKTKKEKRKQATPLPLKKASSIFEIKAKINSSLPLNSIKMLCLSKIQKAERQ